VDYEITILEMEPEPEVLCGVIVERINSAALGAWTSPTRRVAEPVPALDQRCRPLLCIWKSMGLGNKSIVGLAPVIQPGYEKWDCPRQSRLLSSWSNASFRQVRGCRRRTVAFILRLALLCSMMYVAPGGFDARERASRLALELRPQCAWAQAV
jgi:hypothetical protein